jgi:hypothetical protein
MVCHGEQTRLAGCQGTNPGSLEGCRLTTVGLEALPTYKTVLAWFPGPVKDAEWYLLRLRKLNRGLDTGQWRVHERRQ